MKTITYIVSDIDKALAFEWVALHLPAKKVELKFILLNHSNSHLEDFLVKQGIFVRRLNPRKSWFLPLLFLQVAMELMAFRTDVVHTHLRLASLVGIPAAFLTRVPCRIHTRHHSTSNHIYHPHAVKSDRIISFLSTRVVSISDNVTKILLKEGVPQNKIIKIHHGFDLKYLLNTDNTGVEAIKSKYNLESHTPVIGIISRYLELKGIEYGIKAFSSLLKDYPSAVLMLANAKGPYKNVIKKHLEKLPNDSYREIQFENDISSMYKVFDVFLHLPIDDSVEAFGQTYVEAMACGTPLVCTMSGIAHEIVVDGANALVVPYKNSIAVERYIRQILENTEKRRQLVEGGKKSISKFDISDFIDSLTNLYHSSGGSY